MATPDQRRSSVAYLVRSWPRLTQTFVLDEVLALERLGVDVRLFALTDAHEQLVQPEVASVRAQARYLAGRRRVIAEHARIGLRSPLRYARAAWCTARHREWDDGYRSASRAECFALAVRLAGLLRDERRNGGVPGHLHAHFAHDPAAVARLTSLLTGISWSFTAHARDLYQVPRAAIADRVAAATTTITCSRAGAEYLRDLVGEQFQGRVRLIYHGVDTDAFAPEPAPGGQEPRPPLIVSVGRLVDKKGFPELIRACRLLKERGHAFRCEIYGDGPLHDQLTTSVEQLGLGDEVALMGARTRSDLRAELVRADIFALTPFVTSDGDRDGIPNVLLEAMACGLPVVTTAVGGVPELVLHGVNGLLARPHDVQGVATRLGALLDDAKLRARLGAAARATVVEHFDARAGARTLAALFANGGSGR